MDFVIPQFENPLILLLISPVILAAWLAARKGISKPLMLSRVIILSLLIIALAGPYSLTMTTERDDAPKITVVSDQTMSMDLFDMNKGQELFESLKSRTPTTFRKLSGISSPIGNEVLSDAEGNNNILLVSDGNSNYGKDLFDAISLVSKDGSRVYAVEQKPLHNDASIEIESPKNLIVGNENVFNIIVRQAGSETSYRLDVVIDGTPVKSESFIQRERTMTIPFSYSFNKLGSHEITAQITPSSEDRFKLNNIFYKSVFVVPKPKVLAVTSDTSSPLYTIMRSLYETSSSGSLPDNLLPYKAVIIDNKGAGELSADNLRTYVGNGGGLVVVGGDAAYDKGTYNNSPVEALLPIISRAGEFKGGRTIIIVFDSSGSTATVDSETGYSQIELIRANVNKIVKTIDRDSSLGLIAFGGNIEKKEINPMNSDAIRKEYEDWVEEIGPGQMGGNPTNYDNALFEAVEMFEKVSGTKELIMLSDGILPPDILQSGINIVSNFQNQEIRAQFIQLSTRYMTEEVKYAPGYVANAFIWDEIPGNASNRLIVFLKNNFKIDWVETAKIEKIDDGNTVRISTEKNFLSFRLNAKKTRVILEIDDGRRHEFDAEMDEDLRDNIIKLNIKLGGITDYQTLAIAAKTNLLILNPDERINIQTEKSSETTPTPTATPEGFHEYPLAPIDTSHFITKYINISASVTGYNEVTPKLGSDQLVATTRGKPILTTWGFGLGRVASFSTDNGAGDTQWAPSVYSGENARLVSSMINWAIGDPRPKEGVVVQAPDMWAGTAGRIVVTSDTLPQVKLDGAPLDLSRTGPTAYETTISPEKEGFHDLSGYGIAVNYPLEYREIGFNEKLGSVIESNGGRVYGKDEVLGLLLLNIKEKATRTVQKPKSEKEIFLLAALILFLAEVIIRRMKDYRKERPVIEDNPPRTMTEVAE